MLRSVSTFEECGTPIWGADFEQSYERPPGSALLTTFQRLGVSGMQPETKRLRTHVGVVMSREDSPIDMELPQHLLNSPGLSASPPYSGSPSTDLKDCESAPSTDARCVER